MTGKSHFAAALILLSLAAGGFGSVPATTQADRTTVDVRVDPRVELFCIIFHLAGNPEYNQIRLPTYANDVDSHFAPVKDHAVVQLARKLRETRGVSYDAPMSLATKLDDMASLTLRVPLDPWPDGLDGRWTSGDIEQFVQLAKDFVQQSRFDQFIAAHQEFYARSCQRMRATLDRNLKLAWFDGFFGPRRGADFHLVLGLCNGGGNYGTHTRPPSGREDLYAIIGAWNHDVQGVPEYPDSVMPTVIHEFCHSYCNPLVDAHMDLLSSAGEKLFASKAELMRRQAYDNGRTVLYESLVRACVARYRFDNEGPAAGLQEVLSQRQRGFDWVGDMCTALADYEKQRDQYPSLDAYMPHIAKCLNDYVANHSEKHE